MNMQYEMPSSCWCGAYDHVKARHQISTERKFTPLTKASKPQRIEVIEKPIIFPPYMDFGSLYREEVQGYLAFESSTAAFMQFGEIGIYSRIGGKRKNHGQR